MRPSSKFQSLFQVDSRTGHLRVSTNDVKQIEEREYKLDVQVSDGDHVSHGQVLIKSMTTDKLLRRPGSLKLSKQQYVIHVIENQTTNVDRPILAINWPLNANAGETFEFKLTNDVNRHFVLDSSNGLLYLNASNPLDREQYSKFDVSVLVTSRQNIDRYNRYAQAIIQINVDDINDCSPQFERVEYPALLSQDAKLADKLLQTKATDMDLAANGIVRYSLEKDAPDFVEINSNDGRLVVKTQPREDQLAVGRVYRFHIVATDQGNHNEIIDS